MKNMNIRFVYGVMLFLVSCNAKDDTLKGFTKSIYAKTFLDSIRTDVPLFKEMSLLSTDQHIIALGSNKDNLYKVFDSSTGEFQVAFGKSGEGPNEFMHAFPSGMSYQNGHLSLGDINVIRKISNFDDQILNKSDLSFNDTYKLPSEFVPLNYSFFLNDSTICGQAERSKKQLSCFNINSLEINDLFDYPSWREKVVSTANYHLYQSSIKITPNRKHIVIVYSYFPIVKVYNVQDNSVLDVRYASQFDQNSNIEVSSNEMSIVLRDIYKYYSSVVLTNNYIYALYHEGKLERTNDKPGGLNTIPISSKELHIYSIDGNRVANLILEDWMRVFTATQDNKFLYFINPDKEDYLYRMSLEEVI